MRIVLGSKAQLGKGYKSGKIHHLFDEARKKARSAGWLAR